MTQKLQDYISIPVFENKDKMIAIKKTDKNNNAH